MLPRFAVANSCTTYAVGTVGLFFCTLDVSLYDEGEASDVRIWLHMWLHGSACLAQGIGRA